MRRNFINKQVSLPIMVFSQEERERVINVIQNRLHSRLHCSICNSKQLSLVDGYINDSLQDSIGGSFIIGGPVIPKVALICEQCGNIVYLSAGYLGLM